jgi:hypothetical protein
VGASAVTVLRKKASTWASAADRRCIRLAVVAANSSGRHASSEGTGDATVGAGDSGRGYSGTRRLGCSYGVMV